MFIQYADEESQEDAERKVGLYRDLAQAIRTIANTGIPQRVKGYMTVIDSDESAYLPHILECCVLGAIYLDSATDMMLELLASNAGRDLMILQHLNYWCPYKEILTLPNRLPQRFWPKRISPLVPHLNECLVYMNDEMRLSFYEIADVLENPYGFIDSDKPELDTTDYSR
jgi:hypothetical protein